MKRTWNPGSYLGQDPIPDTTQLDFPIDTSLLRQKPNPQPRTASESVFEEEIDPNIVPEILTQLASPIGTANASGTIDVVLNCTDIVGVTRYEVRISKA